jgi:peroxidase
LLTVPLFLPAPLLLQGCDASVMLMASNGDDESHSGADATLSPDAVEAVNKAKAAVEALPGCAGKVSCADILAMAARDVVSLVRTSTTSPSSR